MAKSLDDKLSQERRDFLAVDLAKREFECHKGFVVRSGLKRVPNEAVKCNAFAHEEVPRFPHRYVQFVKSPGGHVLRSNRGMREAFRNHFARCTDFPDQEFRSYLADFLRLQEAKAASCNGLVTEWELRDALK